jgi:hypothetical protein
MLGANVSANVEQGFAMSLEDGARAMKAHKLLDLSPSGGNPGVPTGNRTRVFALKGRVARPP